MNEWLKLGKDEDPTNTIKKIEKKLDEFGIKLKEVQAMCDMDSCYSSHMKIDGEFFDSLGTNGKGLSEILCKASCMGEMMERLSNKMFSPLARLYRMKHLFYEDKYPMYDLLDDKQEVVIKNIIDKYVASIDFPVFFQTKEMYVINMLDMLINNEQRKYFYTVPFYSVDEKKVVYLPEGIFRYVTGSTGMAAGNTLEEASVQALSEIIERYVYYKLLTEDIVPPRIPDEIIEKYPKVSEIVTKIKKNQDYDIRIYDASLGIGLPVVCLIIINKKTGTLGINVGAHPNMEIALQRIFTEAMQGQPLDGFVKNSYYTFEKKNSITNIHNHYKCGIGYVMTNLLKNKPTYGFSIWKDVKDLSNKELLKYMLDILKNNNSKVYIRDVSYLGFPSVYIFASNFSDICINASELQRANAVYRSMTIFKNTENVTINELKELRNVAGVMQNSVEQNSTKTFLINLYGEKETFGVPCEMDALMMITAYLLGDMSSAINMVKNIIKVFNDKEIEDDKKEYFYILLKYFESIYYNVDKDEAKEIIYNTFDKKIVDKVYNDFDDKEKTLGKLYPAKKSISVYHKDESDKGKAINDLFDKLMDKEEKNLSDYTKLASLIE